MITKLSASQKRTIDNISKLSGDVRLYRDSSLTGKSETLRYMRTWFEAGRYGYSQRTRSGMVLSVTINVLSNGMDDPLSLEKYNTLCNEAIEYFNLMRSQS